MKIKNKEFEGNKIQIIHDPKEDPEDELRDEYNLDEIDLKPNPYVKKGKVIIELAPDVARYFKTSKDVNEYLRNQIKHFEKAVE